MKPENTQKSDVQFDSLCGQIALIAEKSEKVWSENNYLSFLAYRIDHVELEIFNRLADHYHEKPKYDTNLNLFEFYIGHGIKDAENKHKGYTFIYVRSELVHQTISFEPVSRPATT